MQNTGNPRSDDRAGLAEPDSNATRGSGGTRGSSVAPGGHFRSRAEATEWNGPVEAVHESLNEQATRRIGILVRIALVWAAIIVARLFHLQVISYDEYKEIAQSQQQRVLAVVAKRGKILDRNNQELAMSTAAKSVCVNPQLIADPEVSAEVMGQILGVNSIELCDLIKKKTAAGSGFLWVKRRITTEEFQRLSNLKIKGIEFRDESYRSYPKGQLASHVLGCTDKEEKGCGGIELGLDDELEGLPGSVRQLKDVTNRGYESTQETKPQPGKDVWLTIDERIQYMAEERLAEAVQGCRCKTGSIVVMDPHNGDILAMASYPTFNPNDPVKVGESLSSRLNQAIAAPFEPGSVFKVITLSAALETTRLTPDSPINCMGGTLTLFGRTIHEAKNGFGVIPMRTVLAKSSNIGAIQVGMQVGAKNLYQYITAFGFGKRTGLPLPAESAGRVYEPRKWGATSMASVAMGHEVTTTTLQLAQAISTVANNGMRVKPRIVLKRQRPGEPVQWEPVAEPLKVMEARNAFKMRDMMHDVLLPGGTGTSANVAGYLIGGKTGSAQMYDHDTRVYTHKFNASFVGIVPLTRPRLVVVVTLNGSSAYGGIVAAPVFKQVAGAALRILDVPKDQELPQTVQVSAKVDPDSEVDLADAPPEPTMTDDEDGVKTAELRMPDPNMMRTPNLMGKSKRDVLSETTAAGLLVEVRGTGMSRRQRPAPGAPLPRGEKIVVEFRR